jgi:Domain of unknown function (DUF4397)
VITKRAARRSTLALLAAGVFFASAGATISPSYAANDTLIYIVQGLPGDSLNVAIDQDPPIAHDVQTASAAGPFKLQPGSHTVTFSENGKTVLNKGFTLKEGSKADLVAHLLDSSSSDLMVYDKYDAITVTKGKALLVVTHAAAAGPVDIRVNGKVLFRNIANDMSSERRVPGGTYKVSVVPAGKAKPVYFGPTDLTVEEGTMNHVYLVGDSKQETFTVVQQVLAAETTGSVNPSLINTGNGGQAIRRTPLWEVNLVR